MRYLKKLLCAFLASMILVFGTVTALAEVFTEDQFSNFYCGTLIVNAYVENTVSFNGITYYFKNTETGNTIRVEAPYGEDEALETEFPEGTYEFAYAFYDNEELTNYSQKISPETFTVTEGEETEINFYVTQDITQPQSRAFRVVVSGDFEGHFFIKAENTADAHYEDNDAAFYQKEVVVTEEETYVSVYAGTLNVTSVGMYDADKNPVDCYYLAETTIERNKDATDVTYNIVPASEVTSEDEKAEMEAAGFVLMSAEDMPKYSERETYSSELDEYETFSERNINGTDDDEKETVSAYEEAREATEDYEEETKEEEEEVSSVWGYVLAAAAIAALVVWAFYKNGGRKKKNKKGTAKEKEETEEKEE